jgi:hypothetical protein
LRQSLELKEEHNRFPHSSDQINTQTTTKPSMFE